MHLIMVDIFTALMMTDIIFAKVATGQSFAAQPPIIF